MKRSFMPPLLASPPPAGHVLRWGFAGTLLIVMPPDVWGPLSGMLFGLAAGLVTGLGLVLVISRRARLPAIPSLGLAPRTRLAAAVITGAVFEELVWRGLAFQVLRDHVPVTLVFVISAGGFAVLHYPSQGARGVATHLVTGSAFVGLVLATGSLLSALVAHASYNALAFSARLPPEARIPRPNGFPR